MTSNEIEEYKKAFGPIKEIIPGDKSVRIITKDGKVYEAARKKDPSLFDLTWDPLWGVTSSMLPKEMQAWFKNFAAYYKRGDKLAAALMKTGSALMAKWAAKKKVPAPVVVAQQKKEVNTEGGRQHS